MAELQYLTMNHAAFRVIVENRMHTHLVTYAYLCARYNANVGAAWPSKRRIAQDTGLSVRTVKRHISDLCAVGLLEREERRRPDGGNMTNFYRILTVDRPEPAMSPEGGRAEDPGGVMDAPQKESVEEEHSSRKKSVYNYSSKFLEFWSEYPRRVGKRTAFRAYQSALKRASHEEILTGLAKQRFSIDIKYIPHPATWLNRDGWEDIPAHAANLSGLESLHRSLHDEDPRGTFSDGGGVDDWLVGLGGATGIRPGDVPGVRDRRSRWGGKSGGEMLDGEILSPDDSGHQQILEGGGSTRRLGTSGGNRPEHEGTESPGTIGMGAIEGRSVEYRGSAGAVESIPGRNGPGGSAGGSWSSGDGQVGVRGDCG